MKTATLESTDVQQDVDMAVEDDPAYMTSNTSEMPSKEKFIPGMWLG